MSLGVQCWTNKTKVISFSLLPGMRDGSLRTDLAVIQTGKRSAVASHNAIVARIYLHLGHW